MHSKWTLSLSRFSRVSMCWIQWSHSPTTVTKMSMWHPNQLSCLKVVASHKNLKPRKEFIQECPNLVNKSPKISSLNCLLLRRRQLTSYCSRDPTQTICSMTSPGFSHGTPTLRLKTNLMIFHSARLLQKVPTQVNFLFLLQTLSTKNILSCSTEQLKNPKGRLTRYPYFIALFRRRTPSSRSYFRKLWAQMIFTWNLLKRIIIMMVVAMWTKILERCRSCSLTSKFKKTRLMTGHKYYSMKVAKLKMLKKAFVICLKQSSLVCSVRSPVP